MSKTETTAGKEVRYDSVGPIRKMCGAERYVMVRRPHCAPFTLSLDDWHKLSLTPATIGDRRSPRAMHYGVLS